MTKKFLKKYTMHILSFTIPFFIMLSVFILLKTLTKYVVFQSDLQDQYITFFTYLKDLFKGEQGIYSFSNCLGGTMFATIVYYLTSPLNIIILLSNEINISNIVALVIAIKISLAGLNMYIYLLSKFKEAKKHILLLFSSLYALMAYSINFYFNLMWLDVVYMTPLVIMGLDKLIDNKGYLMYAISLFIAIFANFYIAYMLCIFVAIYFIEQLWIKYNFKNVGKQIKNFIVISLLVGIICTVFLLPMGLELFNNSNKTTEMEKLEVKFDVLSLFMKTFIGTNTSNQGTNSAYYNCYIGLIALPLIYFYFVNRNIKFKDKISAAIIILILIFPYFINTYNQIWHGFCAPIGFHYRQAFLLCFYLLILAFKSCQKIDNIKFRHYIIFYIGYLILAFLVVKKGYETCKIPNVLISLCFITVELILLKLKNKQNIEYLLLIVIIMELFLNCFISIGCFRFETKNNFAEYGYKLKQELTKYYDNNYRFEKDMHITANDTFLLNYKGVTSFNTMIPGKTRAFLKKVGYYDSQNSEIYSFQNIITDSLIGIKTSISGFNYGYYNLVETLEKNVDIITGERKKITYNVYENPYALKLGYAIDKNENNYKLNSNNYIRYTEDLLNYLTNSNDKYFIEYELEDNGKSYVIKLNPNEVTYFTTYSGATIVIHKDSIRKNKTENMEVEYNQNENTLTIKGLNKNSFLCGYYNVELIKEKLNKLREHELNIEINKGSYIKANIKLDDKSTLFTTIPYEENWDIYVDGKKSNYYEMLDQFIAIDLDKGEHVIEFKYNVRGLKEGTIISIIGVLLLITYCVYDKRRK